MIKSQEEAKFEIEDSFVAPWGLANEERPMHLLWEGDIDEVEIRFAEPVDLVEGYNITEELEIYESVEEYEDGSDIHVLTIPAEAFTTPGYFSAKFTVPEIFEEAIVAQAVHVIFHLPDDNTVDWEEYTFTIRPQIEIGEHPEKIVLNGEEDEEELENIDITMHYIGFGMAQVDTEAHTEGELISKGESIYHDIAEAMKESGLYGKDTELQPVPEEWKEETNVGIPQEEMEKFVDEFRESLREDSMSDILDEEDVEELLAFLEAGDEERDMSKLYQHFEFMLLNSIIDVVDRHPTENVQLRKPQTKVQIESRMRGFVVQYHLSDNQGNEYESIEVPIEIEDKRDDGGMVEMEINTEWEQHQINPRELQQLKEEIANL
jgi:hypothetical protein